jgi:putative membrane protein
MRKLILRWGIAAVGIYAAMRFIPGIRVDGGIGVYLGVALIMGLVNALISPIVKVLTCPLILLTLGLFTLVINGLMFWLTAALAAALGLGFAIDSFGDAVLGAFVVSLVSFALSALIGVNRDERRERD